jgi:DNA adenine methylase
MNAGASIEVERPLVRYHGGKWMLAPWITSFFPEHRIFTETFGGGGSVLLRKRRSYAEIYNDLDGEMVNLFRVVRDRGEELVRAVSLTPFSRDEYAVAEQPCHDPLERARRTVIRSHMGFAGGITKKTGFRANCKRHGTIPAMDWRNYPEAIVNVIERLRGVVIDNRDALDVMAIHDSPETLHYVDPPYLFDTRGDTRADYRFEMDEAGHRRLAEVIRSMKGRVILSGYASTLYDLELFADWHREVRPTNADGGRPRVEVLWMNFTPTHQTDFLK